MAFNTGMLQAYFRGFVNECKDNMFDDGAEVLMERLTKAADAIGETLDDAMGKLAEKVGSPCLIIWIFVDFFSDRSQHGCPLGRCTG